MTPLFCCVVFLYNISKTLCCFWGHLSRLRSQFSLKSQINDASPPLILRAIDKMAEIWLWLRGKR
jgi:hypothetical protein